MKKIKLVLLMLILIGTAKNSKASGVVLHFDGSRQVCPGLNSYTISYSTGSGEIGQTIMLDCGGAGVFQSTNSSHMEILNPQSITSYNINIIWSPGNGVSWIKATMDWRAIYGHGTANATFDNVIIGIPTNPTAINVLSYPCANSTNAFSITCPNALPAGTNASGYLWSTSNGTISAQGQTVTITPTSGTSDIVVAVRFYGYCSQSGSYSIIIPRTAAVPSYSITTTPGSSLIDLRLVPINGSQGITNVTWTKVSGSGVLTIYADQFIATVEGSPTQVWTMTVNITATNCKGTTTIQRTYSNPSPVDCKTCRTQANINNVEANDQTTSVYPNPANEGITISVNEESLRSAANSTHYFQLFNALGECKETREITNSQTVIDADQLRKGIYFLKIYINGKTESHKLLFQ
jgi:hypothetical protein